MTNKTRKRSFKVPEKLPSINTDIFKEKEVDFSVEEIKKQEELKQRLERLQKFKESEKKKLEEIEMLQKEQLRKLDNKIEDIKLYKEGDPDDIVYGAFLENKGEDNVQVKIYDSKECETFEYNTVDTTFQDSLMEFFKDTPSIVNEVITTRKVEKLILDEPKKIKKADTPIDFTKNVKALIDERKHSINPQYTKPETTISIDIKPSQIIDQIIPHRNNNVVSSLSRGRGPTSRTSSKLSDYKRSV